MELLKTVAEKRLVVMVTHNSELAEAYSTRIVKLRDGQIIEDSDPYTPDQNTPPQEHQEILELQQSADQKGPNHFDGPGWVDWHYRNCSDSVPL